MITILLKFAFWGGKMTSAEFDGARAGGLSRVEVKVFMSVTLYTKVKLWFLLNDLEILFLLLLISIITHHQHQYIDHYW